MAIPGGGITGATVATVGGAMIVAGVMVGRTTPGSAIYKDNNENVNELHVNELHLLHRVLKIRKP